MNAQLSTRNFEFHICSNPKKEKRLKKDLADIYAFAAAEFFSGDKDQVEYMIYDVIKKSFYHARMVAISARTNPLCLIG